MALDGRKISQKIPKFGHDELYHRQKWSGGGRIAPQWLNLIHKRDRNSNGINTRITLIRICNDKLTANRVGHWRRSNDVWHQHWQHIYLIFISSMSDNKSILQCHRTFFFISPLIAVDGKSRGKMGLRIKSIENSI